MSNLFSIKTAENEGKRGFFETVFHLNTSSVDCKDVYLMKWKPRRAAAERAKNKASFWLGLSLRSNWKPVPDQRSTWKKQLTSMSSQLEPAIWSCDTGQRIPCFDRCQLTITWMSNKSNVRCQRCPQMSNWTISFDVRCNGQPEYGRHVGLLLLLLLGYY